MSGAWCPGRAAPGVKPTSFTRFPLDLEEVACCEKLRRSAVAARNSPAAKWTMGLTVSVFDGTSPLITNLPLSGGKLSFSVPNLSVGTHAITATYNGDSKNSGGTSAVLTQTVTAH
jgi:hypothetical protein